MAWESGSSSEGLWILCRQKGSWPKDLHIFSNSIATLLPYLNLLRGEGCRFWAYDLLWQWLRAGILQRKLLSSLEETLIRSARSSLTSQLTLAWKISRRMVKVRLNLSWRSWKIVDGNSLDGDSRSKSFNEGSWTLGRDLGRHFYFDLKASWWRSRNSG